MDISLDLVPSPKRTPLFSSFSSGISLVSLLEKYFEVDQFSGSYLYDCEHCSRPPARTEPPISPDFHHIDDQSATKLNEKEEPEILSNKGHNSPNDEGEASISAEPFIGSLSDSFSSISISSQHDSLEFSKRDRCTDDSESSPGETLIPDVLDKKKSPVFRKAEKWYRIEIFPEVLVFHLKRFSSVSRGRFTKSTEKVTVPPQLDMSPFFNDEKQPNTKVMYELYSLVIHIGSTMESGHYVAHVRMDAPTGGGSHWYYCSDSTIYKIDTLKAYSSDAYILFYKRIS